MSAAIDIFKEKTGYDLRTLFESFILFTSSHYQNIVNYYNGGTMIRDSFVMLDYISGEINKVESLIDSYSNSFKTTEMWDVVNAFSDMQSRIETCQNMGRWQRSSRVNQFSSNVKVDHIQKQNETIERMIFEAGFSDPEAWVGVAIDNQMEEEGYTNKGGALFTIKLPNSSNFTLENIVDYLTAENVFGKDIYKKIEITSDGDVTTLQGRDSLQQTFQTIMSTIRGSIPEFPEDGVPSEVLGSNENVIQYPILMRSLLSMIQKDKRFTSFDVLDIRKENDSVFLELKASTITGDSLTNNIIIA